MSASVLSGPPRLHWPYWAGRAGVTFWDPPLKSKPVMEVGPQRSIAGMGTLQWKRAQNIWEGAQRAGPGEVLRGAQA